MQNSPNCPLVRVCLEDESCTGQESCFIRSCKNINLFPRAKLSLFGNSGITWPREIGHPPVVAETGWPVSTSSSPVPWCLWPNFPTSSPITPLDTHMTQPKASTVQLFKNTCYISCFFITRGRMPTETRLTKKGKGDVQGRLAPGPVGSSSLGSLGLHLLALC